MLFELSTGGSAWYETLGLFLLLAGFVIGLGAVTVIDLHGFLARRSSYWTEATTRTHKVTKPLIWIGFALAFLGGALFYHSYPLTGMTLVLPWLGVMLVLNGCFLSFWVSPFLLAREKEGRQCELLPASWQRAIIVSFCVSFIGWWGSLALVVCTLMAR
jgi:hypothetical protein